MGEHETVAALARQLAEVREQIAGQTDALDEIRAAQATFGARLDVETGPVMVAQARLKTLTGRVDALAKQVEKITGQLAAGSSDEDKGPDVDRWDRGTKEELEQQLAELRSWTGNVLRRNWPGYLRALRPCWTRHTEILWELSTLKAEHARVFGGEKVSLPDAQWWHERWLTGACRRIEDSLRKCDRTRCALQPSKTSQAEPRPGQAPYRPTGHPAVDLAFGGIRPGPRPETDR